MAAPANYTESSLKAYMHAILAEVGTALSWDVTSTNYDEPLNETMLAYGTDDVTAITSADERRKLRTLARREAWRQAMYSTASDYNFTADGARFERAAIHKHCSAMFKQAESEAMVYPDPAYAVSVDSVTYKNDPYRYLPDANRTP